MTPDGFIRKWEAANLKERSGSHEHFADLCRLVGHPTPAEADPEGRWFCFEKGATKTGGGEGWADVWKRGHFAIEYKGRHKDLNAAYAQLQRYAPALESPPLLVVSDMDTIIIHTNFTNTVQETHVIPLEDLRRPEALRMVKWMFTAPQQLRPGITRDAVTEQAAGAFVRVAQRLREAGHDPQRVAHFVNRLMFCMFAEDIGLLADRLFSRLLDSATRDPARFEAMAGQLFKAMGRGGTFGSDEIAWFNGGLFDDDRVLPLDAEALREVAAAARLDWSEIEPSIFGTLFERGLDPAKRSQIGAHYTDAAAILRIVEPVVLAPLKAEWEATRTAVEALAEKGDRARSKSAATKAYKQAQTRLAEFMERLRNLRVLDPACGSGNFLYLALMRLKDLEHQVILEVEALELGLAFPSAVGPHTVRGIEVNAYAAELARVTVWIGEIQWTLRHGLRVTPPILKPLDNIECRDAVLADEGAEAAWPEAEFIVGNPPFLGDKKMIRELGEDYVGRLRGAYAGRVPGGADLVTYWFEKARGQIAAGKAKRAGLVATNSIRGGKNREVLERITKEVPIFAAWSDEPWVVEGAAVRVSLVCFGKEDGTPVLDGEPVAKVHADLTGTETDVTQARRLAENSGVAFIGGMKKGSFDIGGDTARAWLALPTNPNGRPNADVLFPWANGLDVTRRPSDTWIVDFGVDRPLEAAALYEAPFQYVQEHVKPARDRVRNALERERWWLHARPAPDLRKAVSGLTRFLATPRVAKHRLFVWLRAPVICDGQLVVVARDDDTTFGILHSRFHELWALRMCTWLGVGNDPRYTPTTTFQTFPFPEGLTPDLPAADYADDPRAVAIADAARRLNELRENWLNPPELVRREAEVVPGYPDRVLPVDDAAAAELKKRTLTNLYNKRPAWLANAHRDLDRAVAAAYGWDEGLGDDEVLGRLLGLNRERAGG